MLWKRHIAAIGRIQSWLMINKKIIKSWQYLNLKQTNYLSIPAPDIRACLKITRGRDRGIFRRVLVD